LAAITLAACASCGGGGGSNLRKGLENLRDGFAELERVYGVRSTVAFGGGRFVAVGPFGVFRSDEGTAYDLAVNDIQTSHDVFAEDISGVAHGDAGWIATRTPGLAFASADGLEWSSVSIPGPPVKIHGAAFGAGSYVLVGAAGTVLVSGDAQGWEVVESGTRGDLYGVVYASDGFVAVGTAGTILRSSDGAVWTSEASPTDGTLFSVAEGDGVLLATGAAGRLLRSVDGSSWEEVPSGSPFNLYDATFGLGRFVVVGDNGAILVSEDGASSFENVGASPTAGDDTVDLLSITFGKRRFVAVGDVTITSTDGFIW
jgi:photosystem II stability/assembly factor-like uncharacterized protein